MHTNQTHRTETHPSRGNPPTFWINWLTYPAAFTVLFGLFMVFAPQPTLQAYGLLIFKNASQFDGFNPQATAYVQLAHAVMGSVLVGWGALMFMLTRMQLAKGVPEAWGMVALSVLLWYVPDTAFSLYSGFWQNAVLNTGFAILYGVPLVALRKHLR